MAHLEDVHEKREEELPLNIGKFMDTLGGTHHPGTGGSNRKNMP